MPRFLAPAHARRIARGPDVYEVVAGVVELPADLASEMGLVPAPAVPSPVPERLESTREEVAAYVAARDAGRSHAEAFAEVWPGRELEPEPGPEGLARVRELLGAIQGETGEPVPATVEQTANEPAVPRDPADSSWPDESAMRPVSDVAAEHDAAPDRGKKQGKTKK